MRLHTDLATITFVVAYAVLIFLVDRWASRRERGR